MAWAIAGNVKRETNSIRRFFRACDKDLPFVDVGF